VALTQTLGIQVLNCWVPELKLSEIRSSVPCALSCLSTKGTPFSLIFCLFIMNFFGRHCKKNMLAATGPDARCRFIPGFKKHDDLLVSFEGATVDLRWQNFVVDWCRRKVQQRVSEKSSTHHQQPVVLPLQDASHLASYGSLAEGKLSDSQNFPFTDGALGSFFGE
jgi:hypothetical protein